MTLGVFCYLLQPLHFSQPVRLKRSQESDRPAGENIYTAQYNQRKEEEETRKKRAVSNKRTCALFLQSDSMLWEYMIDEDGGLGYVSSVKSCCNELSYKEI